ncbi:hypothetical protein OS493_038921 [Desmophyllum pertusum]|uniref:Uncharacterized protein n=1 Tax=Desmophyllum pertusum TaxID=174260 RepID=A0A9X0CGU6_9CNID|nr:hypothetical protein OS493_038921 [Desmophyllum pertusum]
MRHQEKENEPVAHTTLDKTNKITHDAQRSAFMPSPGECHRKEEFQETKQHSIAFQNERSNDVIKEGGSVEVIQETAAVVRDKRSTDDSCSNDSMIKAEEPENDQGDLSWPSVTEEGAVAMTTDNEPTPSNGDVDMYTHKTGTSGHEVQKYKRCLLANVCEDTITKEKAAENEMLYELCWWNDQPKDETRITEANCTQSQRRRKKRTIWAGSLNRLVRG